MSPGSAGLPQRYLAALRQHMVHGSSTGAEAALAMGRQGVVLGMAVIGLARIHERCLDALGPGGRDDRRVRRADGFFAQAIAPLVDKQAATRKDRVILHRLNQVLERRATALTSTNRRLLLDIGRRKEVERKLRASRGRYHQLWQGSRHLQTDLRRLTHQILASQEGQRRKLSHNLQDDIAQTLLGINARLHALRLSDRKNTSRLKSGISSTQHLVAESAISVQRSSRALKPA